MAEHKAQLHRNTDRNADHSDESNATDHRAPYHKSTISSKQPTDMASSSFQQIKPEEKNLNSSLETNDGTNSTRTPLRRERMAALKTRSSPMSALHTHAAVHDGGTDCQESVRSTNNDGISIRSHIHDNRTKQKMISNHTLKDEGGSYASSSKGMNSFFRHEEMKYYRIVYRGVVSLLSEPDNLSKKSGAYVSYGEIIASVREIDIALPSMEDKTSPPRPRGGALDRYLLKASSPVKSQFSEISSIPSNHSHSHGSPSFAKNTISSLPLYPSSTYTKDKNSIAHVPSEGQFIQKIKMIEVQDVLTGGFAIDAEHTSALNTQSIPRQTHGFTSKQVDHRASSSIVTLEGSKRNKSKNHGYLMQYSQSNGILIAEQIPAPPLLCQPGTFYYRVTSKTPLPILAGPCADAPLTRGLALPGTVHEISLRMGSLDHHGMNIIRNLEDGVVFLRLSHRRGWIADRRFVRTCNEVDEASCNNNHQPALSSDVSVEIVMKEIPDYVDVASFEVCDDMSLGGTSISSASFATPSTIILSRRRLIRHKNVKDSRSGMIVQHRLNRNDSGHVSLPRSDEEMSVNGASDDKYLNETRSKENIESDSPQKPSIYLMRVTAPNGLKILDAPHFQVSSLIKGQSALSKLGIREISDSKGSHNNSKNNSSWEIDVSGKFRILPRGALFEASRRLEKSSNYSSGSGLIKLADNTGWAIVPTAAELLEQYRTSAGINISENDRGTAYEEVGNAITNRTVESFKEESIGWMRVIQPQGIAVSCPPLISSEKNRSMFSSPILPSTKLADDSEMHTSNASSFLDSFRTTRNTDTKIDAFVTGTKASKRVLSSHVIPCGTCIKIDQCALSSSQAPSLSFFRIHGEQGWIPRMIHGMQYCVDIKPPDIRSGSFWFRVQPKDGVKVRIGPSSRSPAIKSNNKYFIFECGEYLRASEVLTIHGHADVDTSSGVNTENQSESFAKLYRKKNSESAANSEKEKDFVSLGSLTTPGEWVHIHCNVDVYLQECVNPPTIQRNIEGWRYEAIYVPGIEIRKGPSLASDVTESRLQHCAIVLVNERVMSEGSTITWLRLKDGRGWVQDVNEQGDCLMKEHTGKTKNAKDGSSVNKIISRLGLHR